MSKTTKAMLAALSLGVAAATGAVDRPDVLPRQDGAISYRVEGAARGLPHAVTVAFKAGGRRLRIEPEGGDTLLVDRDAGQTEMLVAGGRMAVRVGGDPIGRYLSDPRARFTRLGADVVLGRPCTRWAMRAPEAEGTGCVTDDGLILRASGHDRRNQGIALEATRVVSSPQPEAAFALPAGTQPLNLSNLGRSLGLTQ